MRLLLLQVGDAPAGNWPLVDGRADPPLSPAGEAQAAAAASRLAGLPLQAIFHAPSRRARATAAAVAASADRPAPIVLDDLAEIAHGSHEGRNFHDLSRNGDPAFAEFRRSRSWDAFADGEGDAAFAARCRRAVEQAVAGAEPTANRLIVSHGGVLNSIVGQALRLACSMFYMPRGGSLSCLVLSATDPVCLTLNDCRHLPIDPLLDAQDPLLAAEANPVRG